MEVWQIALLTFYSVFSCFDHQGPLCYTYQPVCAGFFGGLIMGDMATGLYIGATLQLMVLGVGTFGGASIPDYVSGALIGTAFAVTSGSTEIGLAIAVPVGVLLIQLDVLARFFNVYLQHIVDAGCEEKNWKKMYRGIFTGILSWTLSRAVPMLVCLVAGQDAVRMLSEMAPEWLINGFNFVGGLLPCVGIAILLRYLPLQRYWMFALLGFFLAAYLKVPILGVAVVGLIAAGIMYKNLKDADATKAAMQVAGPSTAQFEGTIEDDE